MSTTTPTWDAIIVAGGRATRLGGIDKTALVFEGRSLLQRSLDATRSAHRVSIVGVRHSAERSERVSQTEESPRWGGPAAAIVAGLSNLRDSDSEFVVVLASDLPHAVPAVAALVSALGSAVGTALDTGIATDGVIAVDATGSIQPLLAVYRISSLRAAASLLDDVTGIAVRHLIAPLSLTHVDVPTQLTIDVDTPHDAEQLGILLPLLASVST